MSAKKQLLTEKDMTGFLEHQDDNKKLQEMDLQLIETDKDYDVI